MAIFKSILLLSANSPPKLQHCPWGCWNPSACATAPPAPHSRHSWSRLSIFSCCGELDKAEDWLYLRMTLRNLSLMLCQDLPGRTPWFSMIIHIMFPGWQNTGSKKRGKEEIYRLKIEKRLHLLLKISSIPDALWPESIQLSCAPLPQYMVPPSSCGTLVLCLSRSPPWPSCPPSLSPSAKVCFPRQVLLRRGWPGAPKNTSPSNFVLAEERFCSVIVYHYQFLQVPSCWHAECSHRIKLRSFAMLKALVRVHRLFKQFSWKIIVFCFVFFGLTLKAFIKLNTIQIFFLQAK